MKADVDPQKEAERKAANRRRVAESKARRAAGRGCCIFEYDEEMLTDAVRAGHLGNYETDAKKIGVALGKLFREKRANALICPHCNRPIMGG
jgi:hypothetical protein